MPKTSSENHVQNQSLCFPLHSAKIIFSTALSNKSKSTVSCAPSYYKTPRSMTTCRMPQAGRTLLRPAVRSLRVISSPYVDSRFSPAEIQRVELAEDGLNLGLRSADFEGEIGRQSQVIRQQGRLVEHGEGSQVKFAFHQVVSTH